MGKAPSCRDPGDEGRGLGCRRDSPFLETHSPWRVSIGDNSPLHTAQSSGSQTPHLRRAAWSLCPRGGWGIVGTHQGGALHFLHSELPWGQPSCRAQVKCQLPGPLAHQASP